MIRSEVEMLMGLLCNCDDTKCPCRHVGDAIDALSDDMACIEFSCPKWVKDIRVSLTTSSQNESAAAVNLTIGGETQKIGGYTAQATTSMRISLMNGEIVRDLPVVSTDFSDVKYPHICSISNPDTNAVFWRYVRTTVEKSYKPMNDAVDALRERYG